MMVLIKILLMDRLLMEILDKERYFNEATLHLFNYICRNLAYMSNVIEFTESAITDY